MGILQMDIKPAFIEAFSTDISASSHTCHCGITYFDNDVGAWTWDDGELELLQETGMASDDGVHLMGFEGKSFVIACECWHERANKITGFLDSHRQSIATYLNGERERALALANGITQVNV